MATINQIMRKLHRDVGFLAVGLITMYSISGIVLTYRDSDFFKTEKKIEMVVSPNIDKEKLGDALKIKRIKITGEDSRVITFTNGVYDKLTGEAEYTSKEFIYPLNKFVSLHKLSGKNPLHLFGVVLGVMLIFLIISSFWMYKPGTKMFKRSIVFTLIGLVVSLVVLMVI